MESSFPHEAILGDFAMEVDSTLDGFDLQSLAFDSSVSYHADDNWGDWNHNYADETISNVLMDGSDMTKEPDIQPNVSCAEPCGAKRPRGPSAAQWESYRGLIVELYVVRELKLDDVQALMEAQHGFHATRHMYKKRLKDWGAFKNYTQQQKLDVLSAMQHDTSPSSFVVNGKPLKTSRLRRTIQRNGVRMALSIRARQATSPQNPEKSLHEITGSLHPPQDDNGRNDQRRAKPTSASVLQVQTVQLQQSPEARNIEIILWHVKILVDSGSSTRGVHGRVQGNFIFALSFCTSFLSADMCLALSYLNDACGATCHVFQHPTSHLVQNLLLILSDPRWGRYPEVKSLAMRHFAAIAQKVLGGSHPLTSILRIIVSDKIIDNMLPKISQLVADVTSGMLRSLTRAWLGFQICVAELYMVLMESKAAQMAINSFNIAIERCGRHVLSNLRMGRMWVLMGMRPVEGLDEAERCLLNAVGVQEKGRPL